jgi:pimeloyl-ACP methyl ester carboxylesterase
MGGSSRPDFKLKTREETDEFLIDWMEKWRAAFNDLKDFVLAGHSYGGYIASLYACRYQKYIKKLLLLSPAGVPISPSDEEYFKILEQRPKNARPPKFAIKLSK